MAQFLVTEAAMRPAGNGARRCFYCHSAIGSPHKEDCVTIRREWRVRVTFEIDLDMPASWDREMVDFHLHESSWCASNIANEIERLDAKNKPCLCRTFSAELVAESDVAFLSGD